MAAGSVLEDVGGVLAPEASEPDEDCEEAAPRRHGGRRLRRLAVRAEGWDCFWGCGFSKRVTMVRTTAPGLRRLVLIRMVATRR